MAKRSNADHQSGSYSHMHKLLVKNVIWGLDKIALGSVQGRRRGVGGGGGEGTIILDLVCFL